MQSFVKVVWNDAEDCKQTWYDAEDLKREFEKPHCQVASYGFVVLENDDYVWLAADYIPRDKNWGRITRIPKGMIVSRQTEGQ